MHRLSEKTLSGFPLSPGITEALVRLGGKISYLVIVYFISNICVKIIKLD